MLTYVQTCALPLSQRALVRRHVLADPLFLYVADVRDFASAHFHAADGGDECLDVPDDLQLAELLALVGPECAGSQFSIDPFITIVRPERKLREVEGLRLPVQHSVARRQLQVRKIAERGRGNRSEEHTSELQSLMRISYAVFCL